MTTHKPYPVRIDPAGATAAAFIHAIARQSIRPNSRVSKPVHAGSPYPQSVTINAQQNEATFSTLDIANALGLIGAEGVGLETNGAEFYQLKDDPLTGLPDSTAVHDILQIKRGLIFPTRLSCNHQDDATLDIRILATKDPTTAIEAANLPITKLTDQALPTGLAGDERYSLGPITVSGTTIPQNLSLEVDFGLAVSSSGANSDVFDSDVSIDESVPTVGIGGKNAELFAESIGLLGAAPTHANTTIYLRKRKADSAEFVADATAEHISITTAGLAHWEEGHSADNNNQIENRLRIECRHDGTNIPLVIQTGVAIS